MEDCHVRFSSVELVLVGRFMSVCTACMYARFLSHAQSIMCKALIFCASIDAVAASAPGE
jgi:hypothetical protein